MSSPNITFHSAHVPWTVPDIFQRREKACLQLSTLTDNFSNLKYEPAYSHLSYASVESLVESLTYRRHLLPGEEVKQEDSVV